MKIPKTQDRYWSFLTDRRTLQRAAHLVADDSRNDFQESYLDRQIFTHYRDQIISEIIDALSTGRYLPHPATPANIPKSEFSERPGSLLPYRDRIVVQAITMIIAPIADELLSENVWSWRVKDEIKGKTPDQIKTGLFKESDISDFPFLKKRSIKKYVDEFEPWYALWPKFEELTTDALRDGRYKWMLVSDISGYFENIQIDMLRDLLISNIPGANNTINLLIDHLRAWSSRTYEGAPIKRGIPQGNSVSSFLGNIFLKPVDDHFDFHFGEEVKYFRYMDDIRILAETRETAVNAALALEGQIRLCQLNLQSSKTKLLTATDALKLITDQRLDRLDELKASMNERSIEKTAALNVLEDIYKSRGTWKGTKSIKNRPADGLNLRILRRWAQAHYELGSSLPVDRMVDEALGNPDYKVTRELLKIGRRFPGKHGAALKIAAFITSGSAAFDHHEAELLRALRYFHRLPDAAADRAIRNLLAQEADPYVRVQSARLIAKIPEDLEDADRMVVSCLKSPDIRVITAGVMAASFDDAASVSLRLRQFSGHSAHDVLRLTQYIRALRRESKPREDLLGFIFTTPSATAQRVYDYAAFLRFIACGSADASEAIIARCETALAGRFIASELRLFLTFLRNKARSNLSWLAKGNQGRDD